MTKESKKEQPLFFCRFAFTFFVESPAKKFDSPLPVALLI